MSCAEHVECVQGMKNLGENNSSVTCQKQVKLFKRGHGRPFLTVDVKNLIFWAAYSVQGLFNCKHKPFILTVLVDASQLLT